MTRSLLGLITPLPLICFAEIYMWTDKGGHVHFGDKPKDKDQALQLSIKTNSHKSASCVLFTPALGATPKCVIMYFAAWGLLKTHFLHQTEKFINAS